MKLNRPEKYFIKKVFPCEYEVLSYLEHHCESSIFDKFSEDSFFFQISTPFWNS